MGHSVNFLEDGSVWFDIDMNFYERDWERIIKIFSNPGFWDKAPQEIKEKEMEKYYALSAMRDELFLEFKVNILKNCLDCGISFRNNFTNDFKNIVIVTPGYRRAFIHHKNCKYSEF